MYDGLKKMCYVYAAYKISPYAMASVVYPIVSKIEAVFPSQITGEIF